mmetsp:Transcript_47537/g.115760  ORF Transcript_47537/g.115760 Transcript_47537/m.115760 type:complete len:653 (-) Transcript_47537:3140-5098(-)
MVPHASEGPHPSAGRAPAQGIAAGERRVRTLVGCAAAVAVVLVCALAASLPGAQQRPSELAGWPAGRRGEAALLSRRAAAYWGDVDGAHGAGEPALGEGAGTQALASSWDAVRGARQVHSNVLALIDHYSDPHGVDSHRDLQGGYDALDTAAREWGTHRRTLAHLRSKIQQQEARLRGMHAKESALAQRHRLLRSEIEGLAGEASSIEVDLDSLRGRYTRRIEELRDEYERSQHAVAIQRAKAEGQLKDNRMQLEALRGEVSEAMAKSAVYQQEVQHGQLDVEERRQRAQEDREQEKDSVAAGKRAYEHQVAAQHEQAHRLAMERSAQLRARATKDISRMEAHSQKFVDRKDTQTIKTEAQSDIQVELENAAKKATASAEQEEQETKASVAQLEKDTDAEEGKILAAKADINDNKVLETTYSDRLREAKKEGKELRRREKELMDKINADETIVQGASAKETQADTQAQLAQINAEAEQAAAAHKMQEAEDAEAEGAKKVEEDKAAKDENESLRADLLKEELDAIKQKLDMQSVAMKATGEAHIEDEMSDLILHTAEDKKERADKLLKSVDSLAALAKEAAEMARADQIRAQAARVADSLRPKQPIQVNVIAHKPRERQIRREPAPFVLPTIGNPYEQGDEGKDHMTAAGIKV